MAYIPPHKRHSSSATPTPPPRFNKPKSNSKSARFAIFYPKSAISKWFPVGLSAEDSSQLSCITHLQPLQHHRIYQEFGGLKPLVLVLNHHALQDFEDGEGTIEFLADPWTFVAENVKQDLFSSFERVKELAVNGYEEVKPSLVAKIGKVLFYRRDSSSEDLIGRDCLDESTLRDTKRMFCASVPTSCIDYLINEVVPTMGFRFHLEKEFYHVKLSDSKRPNTTISCKCIVAGHNKIELHKVLVDRERHFWADMSCLDKNFDLRLMLGARKITTALTDNEIDMIKRLITYAILDPTTEGGIRWPPGNDFSGDQYSVIKVSHIASKTFESSSRIRLKVRKADRFDFRSLIREADMEVTVKMHGIVSQLQEEEVQGDLISIMLQDNLRLIWECFLNGPDH